MSIFTKASEGYTQPMPFGWKGKLKRAVNEAKRPRISNHLPQSGFVILEKNHFNRVASLLKSGLPVEDVFGELFYYDDVHDTTFKSFINTAAFMYQNYVIHQSDTTKAHYLANFYLMEMEYERYHMGWSGDSPSNSQRILRNATNSLIEHPHYYDLFYSLIYTGASKKKSAVGVHDTFFSCLPGTNHLAATAEEAEIQLIHITKQYQVYDFAIFDSEAELLLPIIVEEAFTGGNEALKKYKKTFTLIMNFLGPEYAYSLYRGHRDEQNLRKEIFRHIDEQRSNKKIEEAQVRKFQELMLTEAGMDTMIGLPLDWQRKVLV